MAVRQDTIWERFLSPVVRLLIDEEGLRRYADSIDWEKEGYAYAGCMVDKSDN